MQANGKPETDGTASPASRATRRLADARLAAADLRVDASTWLRLRRRRIGHGVQRALYRLLGWLAFAFVVLITAATAAVLLLVGAAGSLAALLEVEPATGAMIVGLAALVSLAALLALGRRRDDRPELEHAEARVQRAMGVSVHRLARSVWTLPGLLVVGVAGYVSVRALRDRRLRRLLLFGLGALRTTGRVLHRAGAATHRAAG